MVGFARPRLVYICDPERREVWLSDNQSRLLLEWNATNPTRRISRSGFYYSLKNATKLKGQLEVGEAEVESYAAPADYTLLLVNAVP